MDPTTIKDYYAVLGVEKTASPVEITKKYKKLVFQHHPDRNIGNEAATTKFAEISEAYSNLNDEEKRKEYEKKRAEDAAGKYTFQKKPGHSGMAQGGPPSVGRPGMSNAHTFEGTSGMHGGGSWSEPPRHHPKFDRPANGGPQSPGMGGAHPQCSYPNRSSPELFERDRFGYPLAPRSSKMSSYPGPEQARENCAPPANGRSRPYNIEVRSPGYDAQQEEEDWAPPPVFEKAQARIVVAAPGSYAQQEKEYWAPHVQKRPSASPSMEGHYHGSEQMEGNFARYADDGPPDRTVFGSPYTDEGQAGGSRAPQSVNKPSYLTVVREPPPNETPNRSPRDDSKHTKSPRYHTRHSGEHSSQYRSSGENSNWHGSRGKDSTQHRSRGRILHHIEVEKKTLHGVEVEINHNRSSGTSIVQTGSAIEMSLSRNTEVKAGGGRTEANHTKKKSFASATIADASLNQSAGTRKRARKSKRRTGKAGGGLVDLPLDWLMETIQICRSLGVFCINFATS